jgi:hypothetical protein
MNLLPRQFPTQCRTDRSHFRHFHRFICALCSGLLFATKPDFLDDALIVGGGLVLVQPEMER